MSDPQPGPVIAIDGPVGSGKSAAARGVAARIGALHLDTGAMYRAIGLAVRRRGDDPDDAAAAAAAARASRLDLRPSPDGLRVLLDGEDVTDAIRTGEASADASRVAAHPEVRAVLVAEQQRIGAGARAHGGVVAEGRDTGTVVFPDADLKVFLTCDLEQRVERRAGDLEARGEDVDRDALRREIRARDERDTGRAADPLRAADDARTLDTTDLTLDQVVERIAAMASAT